MAFGVTKSRSDFLHSYRLVLHNVLQVQLLYLRSLKQDNFLVASFRKICGTLLDNLDKHLFAYCEFVN
jgi:hypothetical protein